MDSTIRREEPYGEFRGGDAGGFASMRQKDLCTLALVPGDAKSFGGSAPCCSRLSPTKDGPFVRKKSKVALGVLTCDM